MRALLNIAMASVLLMGCSTMPSRAPLAGDPVAPDVSVLRGRFVSGAQPDGNSVLLRGRDGLIVVDSGRHAAHTARIVEAARAADLPVVAIVNTHWHLDHVAGNTALRAAYPQAEVLASDAIHGALEGFLADYRAQLVAMLDKREVASELVAEGWRAEIARIDAGAQLIPTRPVTADKATTLAGRRVRLGLERNAVSGGDVWLLDVATRTLVAGDLVTLPVPLFDTACADGWREALQRLDAVGFEQLVPGHGAPMSHAQFRGYRIAFGHLLDCAASDAPVSSCRAGWLHDAGALVPAEDVGLATTLLDYYVGGILRAPRDRQQEYCRVGAAT